MPKRPNILWLMTDEQRADSLRAGGAAWAHTPNLDRLANCGVRFDAAYTPSPVCVSARVSMLTGLRCSSLGVLNNHHLLPPERARFLTDHFAAAGYQTASFGKHHYNCRGRSAFQTQGGICLGDRVQYFKYNDDVTLEETNAVRYEGDVVYNWLFAGRYPGGIDDTPEMHNVREALKWMGQHDTGKPFFLRLSFNAPHTPVVTPAPFDTMIDPRAIDLPMDFPADVPDAPSPVREHLIEQAGSHRLTPEQIQRTRQCYYGYVAATDHAFGVLLDGLREMGALDNTIVAFVADHGAHLADHAFYQKQSYYEESARVPFFFCGPGIAESKGLKTPINVSSLLPTLMDLAGLDVPEAAHYPSLAESLTNSAEPAPRPIFSEIDLGVWDYRDGDRWVMVRDGDWKLAVYRNPQDPNRFPQGDGLMLHNLAGDPDERRNLAGDAHFAAIVDRLVGLIDAWDQSHDARQSVVRPSAPRKRASERN